MRVAITKCFKGCVKLSGRQRPDSALAIALLLEVETKFYITCKIYSSGTSGSSSEYFLLQFKDVFFSR